jgi:hypothetical protein
MSSARRILTTSLSTLAAPSRTIGRKSGRSYRGYKRQDSRSISISTTSRYRALNTSGLSLRPERGSESTLKRLEQLSSRSARKLLREFGGSSDS